VIIGILALLIIPNITSAPKKARDTKRKTDITTLRKGLEEYFVNNNSYPAALTDLTTGSAPIVKTLPTDPKNASPYVYAYTPANSNTTYTLTACLENDADSGDSVIAPANPCTTKTFQLTNSN
jgi:type II secretory pathway pseudopilin PulG